MNIILILIPLSIVLLIFAGIALFWAINHGQFDDLDTPAISILVDDDEAPGGRDREGESQGEDNDPEPPG